MGWDFTKSVDFIRKNASKPDFPGLMRAPSRPYGDMRTKIFLNYYSMPDWLTIATTSVVPGGAVPTAEGPIINVLMEMESEAGRCLSEVFLFNYMSPTDLKLAFISLVAAYRRAAKTHQDGVAALLDQIALRKSGQALLTELDRTSFTTRVMPYWHFFMTMPGQDFYNSTPKGLPPRTMLNHISDGLPSDDNDIYAKGALLRGDDNEPIGTEKGTGKGADVVLFFSARTWTSLWDWPGKPDGLPGFWPMRFSSTNWFT
jgi:hypothetical protein